MKPLVRLAVAVAVLTAVAVPAVAAVVAQGRPEWDGCIDWCHGEGELTPAERAKSAERNHTLARRQLGFTTSPYLVRHGTVERASPLEGLYSPAEIAQIDARRRLVTDAITAHDVATRTLPDSFGGAWFEQRGNGVVHFLVTDRITRAQQACLRAEFDPHAEVVFDRVEWTMADLRAAVEAINADETRWRDEGIPFHTAQPGERRNMVEVHGPEPTAGTLARFTAAYPGPGIVLTPRHRMGGENLWDAISILRAGKWAEAVRARGTGSCA